MLLQDEEYFFVNTFIRLYNKTISIKFDRIKQRSTQLEVQLQTESVLFELRDSQESRESQQLDETKKRSNTKFGWVINLAFALSSRKKTQTMKHRLAQRSGNIMAVNNYYCSKVLICSEALVTYSIFSLFLYRKYMCCYLWKRCSQR